MKKKVAIIVSAVLGGLTVLAAGLVGWMRITGPVAKLPRK